MRAVLLAGLLVFLVAAPLAAPQQPPQPDLGPITEVVDGVGGQVVPPLLNATYTALGQNITREDIRLFLDINFTKGHVGFGGLLIGSGNIDIQAALQLRAELRVISSDRIRAAIEGENAYNISAENATWLSQVYIPAEVFRASASAQLVALFQEEQERALAEYIRESVPELNLLSLDITWQNVFPLLVLTDISLTEPPIVVEIDAVVQYVRVESVPNLLTTYFTGRSSRTQADEAREEYVRDLKAEHGDPLRTRDFFAAAAYTQLLNLSMQPGWSLDVALRVPRGYSFEYVNEEAVSRSKQEVAFRVDALEADAEDHAVILASITHRRAIALVLFATLWVVAGLVAFPARFFYARYRVPRLAGDGAKPGTAPAVGTAQPREAAKQGRGGGR